MEGIKKKLQNYKIQIEDLQEKDRNLCEEKKELKKQIGLVCLMI